MTCTKDWAARAQAAEDAVNGAFGHRLLGLPGTWIGSVKAPGAGLPVPWSEWHYWWQAHYLDSLLDSAWRRACSADTDHEPAGIRAAGSQGGAPHAPVPLTELRRPKALLRSIRLRNFLRWANAFYDDMAWLALAAGRLDTLARTLPTPPGDHSRGARSARAAVRILGRQLDSAHTPELGGGLFWSKRRDFKNTAATAPAALFFARSGRTGAAQQLVDWLHANLLDPELGLYLDGIKIRAGGTEVESNIYSYNQGPVLGALLELGGETNLARAADLVGAVADQLTSSGRDGSSVLKLHGGGDGGLFTGILVRYLSIAARHHALPAQARKLAAELVLATAEALWNGRAEEPVLQFSTSSSEDAAETYPPGTAVELSTQLQAWMTFEGAYQLSASSGKSN